MIEPAWRAAAHRCLMIADPAQKVAATHRLYAALSAGEAPPAAAPPAVERIAAPGRPAAPALVPPRQVPRRGLGSVAGRIAFFHALAHIEFNAINLGLDAVYRFGAQMPSEFSRDWWRVADDEARHFCALLWLLRRHGADYGDCPAHDNLWEMALRTDADALARMALVPRVLEARGLDVAPAMIAKLGQLGDAEAVAVIERILAEEVAHVAIGNRWFLYLCDQRALAPRETFRDLLRRHCRGVLSGPFNDTHRRQAGFSDGELADLRELEAEFARELSGGVGRD